MTDRELMQKALEALEEPKEHIAKHRRLEAITALRERMAQPETTIDKSAARRIATALGWEQRRKWVGLTDEEIETLEMLYAPPVHPDFVNDADHCTELIRRVEAKLKEKNT